MKLLNWGPHTKWLLAFLSTIGSICVIVIAWDQGVASGAVDPYAWLMFKNNAITGFTQNPGYWFLTIHTALLSVIAAWFVKNWRSK